jgi:hypothetical protein
VSHRAVEASRGAEAAAAQTGAQPEVLLGQGQEMLLVVNRAYSLHDTAIGYCQGMNFIVAGIVMHQRKPELTFWTLERIMQHYRLSKTERRLRFAPQCCVYFPPNFVVFFFVMSC